MSKQSMMENSSQVLTVCIENSFWMRAQIPCKCSAKHSQMFSPTVLHCGTSQPERQIHPRSPWGLRRPPRLIFSLFSRTHIPFHALVSLAHAERSVGVWLTSCSHVNQERSPCTNSPPLDNVHRVFLNTSIMAQPL